MTFNSEDTVGERLSGPDELVRRVEQAHAGLPGGKRLIVGIAGAPASGKSTLAHWLVSQLNDARADTPPAIVVPMDGFHLDNAILDEQGLRSVKGAPHTFDAIGFLSLLHRLREPLAGNNAASGTRTSDAIPGTIYIPVFDRAMDLARCAGSAVEIHHTIIVVEGNYLLLNRPVWCELAQYIDLSVTLDVPLEILEERLVRRWTDHGLDIDAATERALGNDIPNARVVTRESARSHLVLAGVRQ